MKSKIARYAFRFTAVTILLGLVTGVGCVIFLMTNTGRNTIIRAANEELQGTLSISSAEGNIFSDLRLNDFRVYDPSGEWLVIDHARLKWNPFHFLTKLPLFQLIEAEQVHIMRAPVYPKAEGGQTEKASFKFESIKQYIPQVIRINDMMIEEGILPQRKSIALIAETRQEAYHIDLKTLEGSKTSLQAVLKPVVNDLSADIVMTEEPGGIVASLLKMPDETALDLTLHLATDVQNDVTLDNALLTLGGTSLSAKGKMNLASNNIEGSAEILADLADWEKLSGTALNGSLKASMNAVGKLDALQTHLTLLSDDLSADEIKFQHLKWDTNAMLDLSDFSRMGFDAKGSIQTDLIHENTYGLTADYTAAGTQEDFIFDLTSALDNPDEKAHIAVKGQAQPLKRIFALLADATASKGKNDFKAHLSASSDEHELRADKIDITGSGLNIQGEGAYKDNLLTGKAGIRITDLAPLAAMLHQDMKGKANADLVFSTEDGSQMAYADIRSFDLSYQRHSLRARGPFTASFEKETFKVSPFDLQLLNGTFSGQGTADKGKLDASFRFSSLQLDPFLQDYEAKARVSGSLTLKGSPESPIITAETNIDGVYDANPIKANVKADWQKEDLKTIFRASSGQAAVNGNALFETGLSLYPFKTDFSKETRVQGNAALSFPLKALNPFLWETRQNIDGLLSGTANIKGQVGKPDIAGNFRLQKGTYRHVPSGVCLENIQAAIQATPESVILTSLSAKNSGGGNLSGKGSLKLTGAQALDGAIRFNKLKLFCGGLAEGIVDGSLFAQGNMTSNKLSGKLQLSPLNIQLPGAQSDVNIPQVETVRLKRNAPVSATHSERQTLLDIILNAPNQVFIRGRGLDAEFGGNIAIRGSATDPSVEGQFKSRRGKFIFFDRNLKLDNALLRFQGAIPPSPFLDVQASTTVQETKIGINLTGSVTKPDVALSSQPSRPQDEVLSLLLFGRELARISPFQALRLARAVRSLSGQDGGEPGVLDQARSGLGLDALDIGTDDQNNVTVSTGKYITDKVFVGVQQGAKPEDKKLKTEIELRPSISANTTVDAQGNQGVGIGWRYDY